MKRLETEGEKAQARADELHKRVEGELRRERHEAEAFLRDGPARAGGLDGDGRGGPRRRRAARRGPGAGGLDDALNDDGWRVEERWHTSTIEAFYRHYDEHFERDVRAHGRAAGRRARRRVREADDGARRRRARLARRREGRAAPRGGRRGEPPAAAARDRAAARGRRVRVRAAVAGAGGGREGVATSDARGLSPRARSHPAGATDLSSPPPSLLPALLLPTSARGCATTSARRSSRRGSRREGRA